MESFRALYTPIVYEELDGIPTCIPKEPQDVESELVLVIAIINLSDVVFVHKDGRLDTGEVQCFTECRADWGYER